MDLIDRSIATYRKEQEDKRLATERWKVTHLVELKATVARYFDAEESDIFSGNEQLVDGSDHEYTVRVGELVISLPDGDLLIHYRCSQDNLVYDSMVAYHNQPTENLAKLGRMFVKHTCPCRKKEIAA